MKDRMTSDETARVTLLPSEFEVGKSVPLRTLYLPDCQRGFVMQQFMKVLNEMSSECFESFPDHGIKVGTLSDTDRALTPGLSEDQTLAVWAGQHRILVYLFLFGDVVETTCRSV